MDKEDALKEWNRYRRWYLKNPVCIVCGKEVTDTAPFQLAIEKGGQRIWIHSSCMKKEQKEWKRKK